MTAKNSHVISESRFSSVSGQPALFSCFVGPLRAFFCHSASSLFPATGPLHPLPSPAALSSSLGPVHSFSLPLSTKLMLSHIFTQIVLLPWSPTPHSYTSVRPLFDFFPWFSSTIRRDSWLHILITIASQYFPPLFTISLANAQWRPLGEYKWRDV